MFEADILICDVRKVTYGKGEDKKTANLCEWFMYGSEGFNTGARNCFVSDDVAGDLYNMRGSLVRAKITVGEYKGKPDWKFQIVA